MRERETRFKSSSPTFSICLSFDLQVASSWKQNPRESDASWQAVYLQSHCEHTFTVPHAVVYLHSALGANLARNYEEHCASFKICEGLYRRLALVSDFIVLSKLIQTCRQSTLRRRRWQVFYFIHVTLLTLYLLTWRIWWAPNNASKGHMGFNSAFKGLKQVFVRSDLICCWQLSYGSTSGFHSVVWAVYRAETSGLRIINLLKPSGHLTHHQC